MADDVGRTAQLEAELRQARDQIAALQRREAALVAENAVLAAERSEALEQQTALGDVLRVIAASPTDLKTVLDTIAATARRLCDSDVGVIQRRAGDHLVT